MAIQEVKIYLLERVEGYNTGERYISRYAEHEMSHNNGQVVCLGERIIDIDFPDIDTRQMQVDALEKAVQAERAESQSRVNILLDRISKLKCITHEVDADGVPV